MPLPKCQLFIVSYGLDFAWAKICVRGIQKFATGFSGVTVVVPLSDLGQFMELEGYTTKDGAPVFVKKYVDTPGKGMLLHQAIKLSADLFNPEADLFMHLDSDCLFKEKVTPEDFMVLGKSVIQCVPYTAFAPGRAEYLWQKNAAHALGYEKEDIIYETMQRHPSVYYARTYKGLRARIERVHKTRFEQYILEKENHFPQGFADWPTMGAYAYLFERDDYSWEILDKPDIQGHPKESHKLWQFWSHASRSQSHVDLQRKQLDIVRSILG